MIPRTMATTGTHPPSDRALAVRLHSARPPTGRPRLPSKVSASTAHTRRSTSGPTASPRRFPTRRRLRRRGSLSTKPLSRSISCAAGSTPRSTSCSSIPLRAVRSLVMDDCCRRDVLTSVTRFRYATEERSDHPLLVSVKSMSRLSES